MTPDGVLYVHALSRFCFQLLPSTRRIRKKSQVRIYDYALLRVSPETVQTIASATFYPIQLQSCSLPVASTETERAREYNLNAEACVGVFFSA